MAASSAGRAPRPDIAAILEDYADFTVRLGLSYHSRYERMRGARALLARLDGLDWHSPTVAAALEDLAQRENSFISYLLLHGHLRPGYSYLLSHHPQLVRQAPHSPYAEDVAAVTGIAPQLGFTPYTVRSLLTEVLMRVLVQTGKRLRDLTPADFKDFRSATQRWEKETGQTTKYWRHYVHAAETVLYHLGIYERPTPHGHAREHTWAGYLKGVAQPELKAEMLRYIEQMAATRRTSTVIGYCHSLVPFARYLAEHHPEVRSVGDLRRDAHIEPYLVWNATREWTPRGGTPQRYSARERQHGVLDIKFFFDTITEWGWEEAPKRRLLFPSDVPKRDKPLPRFIPQDQEARLMAAIRTLQDPFQRYPLEILRATGLRIGELLNLELDCVHQVPGQGAWLKVPLGKLRTERMVPIDAETVAMFDTIAQARGAVRPLPHPETGRPTEFLLMRHGTRVSIALIRNTLRRAVGMAGLVDAKGRPLHITPHQFRHTYATALINAGISLPALMRLLGHVSATMSLRYGHLFDATVRQQYEAALNAAKSQYSPAMLEAAATASGGQPEAYWIENDKLKTRLAHGYCLRELAQQSCPVANVCERCPAFLPLPEEQEVIRRQLEDVKLLIRDATMRGWETEVKRHQEVAGHLQALLGEGRSPSPMTNRPDDTAAG
ncbi:MAG: tyrosine-type recombinase/integrase [Thermaerobacter sp.]|nr:tyrosine-type recombinase/integrase [Thermaerobacter sp.]